MTQPNGGGGMAMLTPERRKEIATAANALTRERHSGFPKAAKNPCAAWQDRLFGRVFEDAVTTDGGTWAPWA